jgi:tetratricopeptide (TPR) repeat protein
VVEEVVRRADGIPLFVEEVTRALADKPAESRGGFNVPVTLRELLTARLDLLPSGARETAQLAAVLGREFRYELLRAASTKEEAELRADLAALQTSSLLFHRRSLRSESYLFKHALVRDAAYDSLPRPARQRLHQRVANTLCQRFPDVERNRPDVLAHHFENGGEIETAVEYLHRGGSQALHRAAYHESLALLDRALALSRSSSDAETRKRREVQLLSTIGSVQILTHGYAADAVEDTFRRALAESTEVGGDIPTPVLFGIWGVAITRSDRAAVESLLPRCREIVDGSGDPVALVTAESALGCAGYWRGDFTDAERAFEAGRSHFASQEFQQYAQTYGYGAGVYAFAFGMLNLWCLGFADQADGVRRELFRIADLARDPYLTAIALGLAVTLAHDRDTPEVELELADRLTSLLAEQNVPVYQAAADVGRGGALLRRGHLDEALPLLEQGVEGFRSIGTLCSYSFFLQYLADAHLRGGRTREALAVTEQAHGLCSTLYARLHEPEIFRLEGLAHWQDGEHATAERSLRAALARARETRGKSYELRAACDLARLLREVGRSKEGHKLLSGVFASFTEGFETPDLLAARDLLAEL